MTPFGKRTTAEQVSEGIDLSGKNALITGANTGIGKECARVLALRGARVTMACRNLEKAEVARRDILKNNPTIESTRLEIMALDLNRLDSVREFAHKFAAMDRPLHLLLNNAGIMINFERRTADGFEAQLGINHLAHFLLTNLLLPSLLRAEGARVVCLSSSAMSWATLTPELEDLNWEARKVNGMRAYGDSKTMNLMFARELSKRYADQGIVANALHPGVIATDLGRDQGVLFKILGLVILPFMKTIPQGAATSIYVATSAECGETGGQYFSDCNKARPPRPVATDDAACALLWQRSEELTGLV